MVNRKVTPIRQAASKPIIAINLSSPESIAFSLFNPLNPCACQLIQSVIIRTKIISVTEVTASTTIAKCASSSDWRIGSS